MMQKDVTCDKETQSFHIQITMTPWNSNHVKKDSTKECDQAEIKCQFLGSFHDPAQISKIYQVGKHVEQDEPMTTVYNIQEKLSTNFSV